MKTKITITLLAAASLLFGANVIKAQTCGSSQVTYTTTSSQNFLPKWNATAGCISNSSIFDNGKVGVGNSSPIYPFEISPVVTAGNLSSGGTWDVGLSVGANGSIGQQSTNKHAVFGTIYTNKDILFVNYDGTTFNERMRIVSGGNVGIGTASPSSLLEVFNGDLTIKAGAGTPNDAGDIIFKDNSGNQKGRIWSLTTSGPSLLLNGDASATAAMIINGSGYVGIGTMTPLSALHIDNSIGLSLDVAGQSYSGPIQFRENHIIRGRFLTVAGDFNLDNYNASGTWLRTAVTVLNGGNVGIGLTNPSVKLEVTGDFKVNGIATCTNMIWSDSIVKTNIDSLHNALTTIGQLIPKSFYFDTANVYGLNFSNKKQYGFIAQDVETVLPELLLSTTKNADVDTLGNIIHPAITLKTLNYTAFIGILTKGIQELQQKNDSLETKTLAQDSTNVSLQNSLNQLIVKTNNQDSINTSLQNQLNQLLNCCNNHDNHGNHGNNLMPSGTNNSEQNNKSMNIQDGTPQGKTTLTDVELSNKNIVVLNQNIPNPFAEQTTISYFLPDNVTRAQILFFEQSGKIIKTVDLTEKGKGTLNVFANDLSNGIYTYSLIIDGQTVETKKMVKQ